MFEERLGITSINNYLEEKGTIYYMVPKIVSKTRYKSLKGYYKEKYDDITIKKVDTIKGINDDIVIFQIEIS